jgi:hypothetical protein
MKIDGELCVSIGGVVGQLRLRRVPAALMARVRKQYAPFTLPCSPRIHCAFSLTVTFTEGARPPADRQPVVRSTSDEIDVWRSDFSAALTAGATAAPWTGVGECQATAVALEALLRILWSVFLPRHGGVLFHACGFRQGGQGFVAAGHVGAGKTALARKIPDRDDLLGDAAVVIHRGATGSWRVSGTPFHGGLGRTAVSLESFSLAALTFLDQQPQLAVSRLPRAEAVLRALECLICYQTDGETVQRNFALVLGLCSQVPTLLLASAASTPLPAILAAVQSAAGIGAVRRGQAAPQSTRELISSLRAKLARHSSYAFRPQGTSMLPLVRSGDSVFIEAVREDQCAPGDVIVYWQAGPRPADDVLICHRMVARVAEGSTSRVYAKGDSLGHIESFSSGRQGEVIGRVQAVSRQGRARAVPSRLGSLALLGLSLMLGPLWKARLRF